MNRKLFPIFFTILIVFLAPQAFAENENTIVVMETNSGKLIFEFFSEDAPNHVKNFIRLSEEGVYTGTMFHRVINGFMIQGGDPNTKDFNKGMDTWGQGSPGYTIDAEFNDIKHNRGILSMARSQDPNSAGSQFFIVHEDSHFLDGQYTVFGRIISEESFETLDRIANLDTIHSQTGQSNIPQGDIPNAPIHAEIIQVDVFDRSELPNLPTLDPPQRTHAKPMETGGGKYTNMDLGVAFNTPKGWLIQTPTQVDSSTPNIVVAGPKVGNISPTLTVTIGKTMYDLKQNVQDFQNQLQPLIDQNVLTVKNTENITVNKYPGYLIIAQANFENQNNEMMELGFATALVNENNRVFQIQYMNTLENYFSQDAHFNEMLNSFEVLSTLPEESQNQSITMEEWEEQTSDGGGCLIATAAFGSEMAPQIQFLREIRDGKVMTTQSGTVFMTGFNQFYYSFSPAVADFERENPIFKEAVKITLTPLLTSLTLLNYVDIDSEQEMLGYGIGIILLNIGMYFVAPILAILRLKTMFTKNNGELVSINAKN